MEKQRIIEIFECIKNNIIKDTRYYSTGICFGLAVLLTAKEITQFEYYFLLDYLRDNKPTPINQYKEFTQNEYWINISYWWVNMGKQPETRQIRVDYLTALINNIK